jgi:hypothetical protein
MASGIKDAARKLVESLPEESTWDDLMRAIYERIMVEKGAADFGHPLDDCAYCRIHETNVSIVVAITEGADPPVIDW